MAFLPTRKTEEPGKSLVETRIWEVDVAIRTHLMRLIDITGTMEYKVFVESDSENRPKAERCSKAERRSKAEREIAERTREIVGALWPLVNEVIQQIAGIKQGRGDTSSASSRRTADMATLTLLREDVIVLDESRISGYALHRLSKGKRTTTPGTRMHCTSIQNIVETVPTLLTRIERNLKALQEGKSECSKLVKEDREEAAWDEQFSRHRGLGGGMIFI